MRSLAIVAGFLMACEPSSSTGAVQPALDFEVFPEVLGAGTDSVLRVTTTRGWYEADSVSFAIDGVEVAPVSVLDYLTAEAMISVPQDIERGVYDLIIRNSQEEKILEDAIEIVDRSISVSPDRAWMGEMVEVDVIGEGTAWTDGYTWADFGDDAIVFDVDVHDGQHATVTLAVSPQGRPGARDIVMQDGPTLTTLSEGFTVDRKVITAAFTPGEVNQGFPYDFRLEGVDTSWNAESTVEFWNASSRVEDITVQEYNVIDEDTIVGQIAVSNAARLGTLHVVVYGENETILLPDAVNVLDSPANMNIVAVGLSYDVVKTINPSTGRVEEEPEAVAYFIIPLIPPCGPAAGPPPDQPVPFDINGVFENPDPPEEVNCPYAETVDAGEHVYFESPENTVRLDREVNFAGQILYVARELEMTDYTFDTSYDLVIQGAAGGVEAQRIPEVIPTVPRDVVITSPYMGDNLVHNRADDFVFEWNPAGTFPTAALVATLNGQIAETNRSGYVGVIPFDDGRHTFGPSKLTQMLPGNVNFSLTAATRGPFFGLEGSSITSNRATSAVSMVGQMELE